MNKTRSKIQIQYLWAKSADQETCAIYSEVFDALREVVSFDVAAQKQVVQLLPQLFDAIEQAKDFELVTREDLLMVLSFVSNDFVLESHRDEDGTMHAPGKIVAKLRRIMEKNIDAATEQNLLPHIKNSVVKPVQSPDVKPKWATAWPWGNQEIEAPKLARLWKDNFKIPERTTRSWFKKVNKVNPNDSRKKLVSQKEARSIFEKHFS